MTEYIVDAWSMVDNEIPHVSYGLPKEEIIRCRDCQFFNEKGIYRDWWCNRLGLKPSKDSFCSWAQKVD